MRSITFLLSLLLLCFSCDKGELSPSTSTEEQELNKSSYNSASPYDAVGVWHNQHLADFYQQEFTPTVTVAGGEEFLRGIGFDGFNGAYPGTAIFVDKLMTAEDFVQQHAHLSAAAKVYLLEMCAASGAIGALEALEVEVLADKTLSAAEQEIVLIGVAVARHSSAYWLVEVDNWVNGADPTIFARNYAKIDATAALGVALSCNLGFVTPPSGMTVLAFSAASGATASTAAAIVDGVSWVGNKIGENTGWW